VRTTPDAINDILLNPMDTERRAESECNPAGVVSTKVHPERCICGALLARSLARASSRTAPTVESVEL
jgi:hypothetical protein